MLHSTDILICGGSLSGLAAAIRLYQHGFLPWVIEKHRFPRPKLCGEFLNPDSFASLQALGIWDAVNQAAYGPINQVVFYTMQNTPVSIQMAWMNPKQPYGFGIPREVLDTLLMDYAKSLGIPVLEQHKVLPMVVKMETRFAVNVYNQNAPAAEPMVFETPILIDASGHQGRLFLKTNSYPDAMPHQAATALGIQCKIRLFTPDNQPIVTMALFPGGYGGLMPLSAEVFNLCMLAPVTAKSMVKQSYETLVAHTLGQNPTIQALLQCSAPVSPVYTTSWHHVPVRSAAQAQSLIRVGDAMATVDPFTGSGMAVALQTGILVADTVAEGLHRGWDYHQIRQQYHDRHAKQFGRRLRILRVFRPFLYSQTRHEYAIGLVKPLLPALARLLCMA